MSYGPSMRTVLIALATLAAVITAYILVTSATNGAQSGYGTPPAFYAIAAALIAASALGALAAYRNSRYAGWAFAAGAVIGVVAWPYLASAAVMGAAVILSLIVNATERRPSNPR